MSNLPSPFKIRQLYRITLRHAAAAVIYSRPASQNLRAMYRAEFDIWMERAKGTSSSIAKEQLEWEEFARRLQNTLEVFHRSSTTLDITDKLTANLADLRYHMDPPAFIEAKTPLKSRMGLSYARPEFLQAKKGKLAGEVQKLYAWDPMAIVAGMAESSAGVFLGKARPRKTLEER